MCNPAFEGQGQGHSCYFRKYFFVVLAPFYRPILIGLDINIKHNNNRDKLVWQHCRLKVKVTDAILKLKILFRGSSPLICELILI